VFIYEYLSSAGNAMHSELKESPVAGPRTLVQPAKGFSSTADIDAKSFWRPSINRWSWEICSRSLHSSQLF